MSIFGSILNKIMGRPAAASTPSAAAAGGTSAAAPATPASSAAPGASAGAAGSGQPMAGQQPVDVAAVLSDLAAKNPQKLDWRHSIVDLMKLLDLDSSLSARRELAQELQYSGDTNDSAAMNIWLHRQVMQKLAENGGRVPDELRR